MYIMPLAFVFSKIFEIPTILEHSLKQIEASSLEPRLSNIINGKAFQDKLKKFNSLLVVPFILYLDDYEINNPLGGRKFPLCGCYVSFPTMPPHLISKLNYVFQIAFISSVSIKACGNEKAFYHLMEEFKIVENGIDIQIGGETKKVHFVLGLIVGDNLEINSVLGFVQSFNSNKFCRACQRCKSETQFDTEEHIQSLRNKTNYASDVLLNDVQETGIKNICIFNELPNFHVTENICFDIMHDVFEGICSYDICNVLVGLIKNKVISLDVINCRKRLFKYGEFEVGNKSGDLDFGRLKTFRLGMTATQIINTIHFLPLCIGDLIPSHNDYWKLILILLDIIEMLFKPDYTTKDLDYLKQLVGEHHKLYIDLFGALKPKHHFLVHYATAIQNFGPLKFLWCMRFEAKHREAKLYFHSITSRVNPPRSLATKSGLKFAKFILDHQQFIEPLVSTNPASKLKFKDQEYYEHISEMPDYNFSKATVHKQLNYNGTVYKIGCYLAIKKSCCEFYKVVDLVLVNENVFIICQQSETTIFDSHYRAYEVLNENEDSPILIKNIITFSSPPLHKYLLNNKKHYLRFKYL